jgi:hypothetical protein
MSNPEVDYSNTIIYKIICKDPTITDIYVGHTVNFPQRKLSHKQNCININSQSHHCKVYDFIRTHGGWDNWKMLTINTFECKNQYEARQKEQEYFILLNATLNSIEPLSDKKTHKIKLTQNKIKKLIKKTCEICNTETNSKEDYKKHLLIHTDKPKVPRKFTCEPCNFSTRKESELKRHIVRKKHLNKIENNVGINDKNITLLLQDSEYFKNTIIEILKITSNFQKEKLEFQNKMLEVCIHKKIPFNLNLFLNKQCNDSMSINEFIISFELKLSDLESIGRLGYVKGMTNIFIDKLNSMSMYNRPIHCSDARRKIIYINDDGTWTREESSYPLLRKVVKTITFKNTQLTNLWRETYPECKSTDSPLNGVYNKIAMQSNGGSGEIGVSEDKIMRNIIKEIVIDKTIM